jgi:hypothetical protein
MNDAPKDPTTVFAEELAKQLPVKAVYRDAVKPAAKQLGQIAQDIVKTIQLALAPLQVAGAYQDRLRAFLDRAVRQVPEDRRISPPPQILGPIVEGIRYEPEETPIDQMFQHLLSTSMDADHSKDAHPAYPLIVKQLSSDEAKILAVVKNSQFEYVYTQDYDQQANLFRGHHVEVDSLPRERRRERRGHGSGMKDVWYGGHQLGPWTTSFWLGLEPGVKSTLPPGLHAF